MYAAGVGRHMELMREEAIVFVRIVNGAPTYYSRDRCCIPAWRGVLHGGWRWVAGGLDGVGSEWVEGKNRRLLGFGRA